MKLSCLSRAAGKSDLPGNMKMISAFAGRLQDIETYSPIPYQPMSLIASAFRSSSHAISAQAGAVSIFASSDRMSELSSCHERRLMSYDCIPVTNVRAASLPCRFHVPCDSQQSKHETLRVFAMPSREGDAEALPA